MYLSNLGGDTIGVVSESVASILRAGGVVVSEEVELFVALGFSNLRVANAGGDAIGVVSELELSVTRDITILRLLDTGGVVESEEVEMFVALGFNFKGVPMGWVDIGVVSSIHNK